LQDFGELPMQDARGCLLELERLATEGSGEKQDVLLDRVTDLFFLTSEQQSAADKAVFGEILERIAYVLELKARARLAERMSEAYGAPHKLIVRLATDDIGVAQPVLEKSPVLRDVDLVCIAAKHGQDHLHAISSRAEISTAVTDVIVERGDDGVLTHMARNKGAEFSPIGLERISERAGGNFDLFSALELRADIPEETLQAIKHNIAERLKAELATGSFEISGEDVDEIVEERASEMNLQSSDPPKLSKEQEKNLRIKNEELILFHARNRDITQTVQSLTLMSGVSVSKVSHCLLEADLSALAVLCKSGELEKTTFAALIQLRSATNPVHGRMVADAMRHYDMLNINTARRAIQVVREGASQPDQN
jgi:uncharacterized protein (DUF2336 family)